MQAVAGNGGAASNSSTVTPVSLGVAAIFQSKGVPPWIWVPIMANESGGYYNAIGHGADHSVGLFQLNPVDGQGVGHSMTTLLNPLKNAEIAASYIAPAYKAATLKYPGGSKSQIFTYTIDNSGHYGDQVQIMQNMLHGMRYQNGWGLTPSGGLVLGQIADINTGKPLNTTEKKIEAAIGKNISTGVSTVISGGESAIAKAISGLNPAKDIESYVSKHWVTWVIVIAMAILIVILLVKGIAPGGMPA